MSRLKTVHIDFPPHDRETHRVDDVCAFLFERFDGAWPDGASIYHGAPSAETDVTPRDGASVEALQALNGEFFVCASPADPVSFLTTVALALFNYAVSAIFAPRPDELTAQNRRISSPNNALGARGNNVRISERIEDIFGQVRAYPSLIAVPYTFFKNNVEYEFAAFCLGRGEYQFDETPREGDTPVTDIDGVAVSAFLPGNNPNSGASPSQSWGAAVTRKIEIVSRSGSILGQTLEAPNARRIEAPAQFAFDYHYLAGGTNPTSNGTGRIWCENPEVDFVGMFQSTTQVTISNAPLTGINGTYNVVATGVDDGGSYIDVDIPSGSGDWAGVSLYRDQVGEISQLGTVQSADGVSIGPFTVGDTDTDRLRLNYVAANGIYKTNGETQRGLDVTIRVTVEKTGEVTETFDVTLTGSAAVRETIGVTQSISPTFSGPYDVTLERITDTDREDGFQTVDEIQVRDLFALAPSTKTGNNDFGDVTILTAETEATARALAQRERNLNLLVTRIVGGLGLQANDYLPINTSPTIADPRFRDILTTVVTDPFIGGLEETDVDWVNIADTYNEVITYFGIDEVGDFSHTFDDLSLSFEDTIQQIARAVFCTAYRDPDDGGKLKFRFERSQADGALLFNHRNTIPGSVTRTVRFGNENDHDGVEVFYTDSSDDTQGSVTLPTGMSPINPRRVRIPGLRGDDKVATLHAWRIWNKIQYGNTRDERQVTDEAALLALGERVEIADETRSDAQTGEVVSQDGLSLTLSQPYTLAGGVDYVILLQLPSGVVESITMSAGANDTTVTLSSAPSESLSLGADNYARATYWIVPDVATARGRGFVVEGVSPTGQRRQQRQLTCVNYDARYYENDDLYA